MLVAMVAKLRNGALIKFRADRGITQAQAGLLCGLSQTAWCSVECMRFKGVAWESVAAIAELLDLPVDDIYPPELRSTNLHLQAIAYLDVQANLLEAQDARNRMTLPDPSALAEKKEVAELLDGMLRTLTVRERAVLELRYGLHGNAPHTLREACKEFGVTRERLRQIQAKAVRKLQRPARADILANALGLTQGGSHADSDLSHR